MEPGWFLLVQVTKAVRVSTDLHAMFCCYLLVKLLKLSSEQPEYTHPLSTVGGVYRGDMPRKPYSECSGAGLSWQGEALQTRGVETRSTL